MKRRLIAILLAITYIFGVKAQPSFDVKYITDVQTNFGRNFNWTNLLYLTLEIPSETISNRWTNGQFHIQSRTALHLSEDGVINDLMGYNNILSERVPFAFSILGYQHQWGRLSLFFGIRNINEDYFADPYMSLFTNSTPGMLPTLSSNFPLADYPFSAVCLHAEIQITDNLFFKTSLYNGIAHSPERNPLRSFVVNPRNDGVFSISEITYSQNRFGRGIYSFGFATHSSRAIRSSFFAEIEQAVFENEQREIGVILQAGYSLLSASNDEWSEDLRCRSILGVGVYFRGFLSRDKRDAFGLYFNTADFETIRERSLELTWRYDLRNWLTIQPTVHVVRTGTQTRTVGMFRFLFSFG